ncbi:energy transducer TonB [Sulfurimonas sp.]|uniref:energy transducer TonB n=1 Tax=Sulfurimonas sp. TaxID=2022749 RepID=UPI0025F124FB|nr:energy transducer TonB [Sulfurimonas sp.]MCK9474148.1 energy transducer TonB [Sulfurimonas sp.]
MISNFYTRAMISVASTTLLHASIFYTLNEIEPNITPSQRVVEIASIESLKKEKKELQVAVAEQKPEPLPKPVPKPVQEPKPVQKLKPEPVVKAEPVAKPKPIVEQSPTPLKEPLLVAQNEVKNMEAKEDTKNNADIEPTSPIKSTQKSQEAQKASSIKEANEIEQYLFKIRAKIQENLRYPPLARRLKIEGESVVRFEISSDGSVNVSSIGIKKSSGHESLDRQAMQTIQDVSPFDAPPKEVISIILPVSFNLNR